MRRLLMCVALLLVIPAVGCAGPDGRLQSVRVQGSYLNDLSGSDPFNVANGSHRTGAEGLEGTQIAVLGGGEVYSFEGDTEDEARIRVDVYVGPSLMLPNGGNYVGKPEAKWVDKDDDSWAIGLLATLDFVYDDPDWFLNPLLSIGGGAHYTHHKWDGQGTNYLFEFRPQLGLEIPTDIVAEGSRMQFLYGLDHLSNGRGRVRNSNDGRNTDIFTFNWTFPF